MPVTISDIWAKDNGETLLKHTLKVTRLARQLCGNLPFPQEERASLAELLTQSTTFHDLGKCAQGFQTALRQRRSWGHRHEILSAALAAQLNPQLCPAGLFAIITHHRSLPSVDGTEQEKCLPDDELPYGNAPTWQAMVSELQPNESALHGLLVVLAKEATITLTPLSLEALRNLGLSRSEGKGLSEAWLRRWAQKRIQVSQRRRASLLRGLLMTSDHLASAGVSSIPDAPRLPDYEMNIQRYELGDSEARPFQKQCHRLCGDAILKAPTGSGKTLAAALWTMHNQSHNGRFFYVLPYTASINAMYRRMLKWFNGQEELVGLLHHRAMAALFEMQENGDACDRAQRARALTSLAHEMYHPVRVCTPHQILRVALLGRGWEMGLSEFTNACFVFDEIHAFEPLLVGLTLATAKWLKSLGARLLFASATLPKFLEQLLTETLSIPSEHIIAPDPTEAGDREICEKVRHRIEVSDGNLLENLAQVAAEIEKSGETTLIVCNHVATSQEVWRSLRDEYGLSAALFHARFNAGDRSRIEDCITGGSPPSVLVATQAVEVSLDLDYERGYTEPAPADALGQRLGRINRKGARPPAHVVIFSEPSAGSLYDETTTERTVALFAQEDDLTEQRLTEIVDKIYENGYQSQALEDFNQGLNHPTITNLEEEITAGTYRPWVEDVIQGADRQIEVLPVDLLSEYQTLADQQRYLEAGMLLVPIRLGQYFKAVRESTIWRDEALREWLTSLEYSSESGLDLSTQFDNII